MFKKISEFFKIGEDFIEIILKGGSALLIRVIGFLSGYFFLYFVAKYYGAGVNGLLSLSFSVMIIGSLISRLGVDISFTKLFSISNNFNNAKGLYFKTIVTISIITFLIVLLVFLFSKQISLLIFKKPELEIYLKWTSPAIFLLTITLINASVLRGLKKNSIYAFLFNGGRFLFTLIFFLTLYYFFEVKNSPIISIISHTFGMFLLFLVSIFYLSKYLLPISFETKYNKLKLIKDSIPMLASASVIVLLGWADTIILGIYKSSNIVGVYHVIIKIAAVTSFTTQALNTILAPKLSHSFHNSNLVLFQKIVSFSLILNFTISFIIAIILLIFHKYILMIFGNEFIIGSAPIMVLIIGQVINSVFGPVGTVLQMTGHQKQFQNILGVALLINILLNLLLVKPFGMLGVSIATAVSLSFWNIASAVYIKKILNINMLKYKI